MYLHDEHTRAPYYRRRSPRTTAAYAGIYARFARWCAQCRRSALPASDDTLAAYLICLHHEGTSPGTLSVVAAAVRAVHAESGFRPPEVSHVLAGLRRAGVPEYPRRSLHVDWFTEPPGPSPHRR